MTQNNAKKSRDARLHVGHRERTRERFLETDGVGMSDHELLELLLFYSVPRSDTNETAHRLIDMFGSLADVINAPYKSLLCVEGVGEKSAILIKLLGVLMNRYSVSKIESKRLRVREAKDAVPYFKQLLFAKSEEEMHVLMFRETGMLIGSQSITMGKDSASVHADMNKCIRLALQNGATFVIVGHNHPNGILEPSSQDVRLTKNLERMLLSVNVTLAEHILIAGNEHRFILEHIHAEESEI